MGLQNKSNMVLFYYISSYNAEHAPTL